MKTMILIPALAPGAELIDYLQALSDAQLGQLVVVDDGSGPDYAPIFALAAQVPGCTVLRHEQNRGKGDALKTGLRYFQELPDRSEYNGVVTADADGQHSVADVTALCRAMRDETGLWLGVRDFSLDHVPAKSRFGNKLTRSIFRIFYHVTISDTQTGLRGYPNCMTERLLDCPGSRYEYETKMLILCAEEHIPIHEVPIETIYLNDNASSHFNPIKDSYRIYRLFFGTFVKFLLSSVSSALIDLLLFNLLIHHVFGVDTTHIFLATAIARVCSSIYNFLMNQKVVFASRGGTGAALVKYYALAAVQMLCSAGLVSLLTHLLPHTPTLNKLIVDTLLFFCSYAIQKRFIFRNRQD